MLSIFRNKFVDHDAQKLSKWFKKRLIQKKKNFVTQIEII